MNNSPPQNAMYYKSGARVGDHYMSLIYTCELAGVNVYEYLNPLQAHARKAEQHLFCKS